MMTTFYIFRHGHTNATLTGTHYDEISKWTADIVPETVNLIKNIAEYLKKFKFDYSVSSEFTRCRNTVNIISKITKQKFEFDNRLNEDIEDDKDKFISRVSNFYNEIILRDYNNVAICTHGAVLAALKYLLLTGYVNSVQLNDFPPPGTIWVIKNKDFKEVVFK